MRLISKQSTLNAMLQLLLLNLQIYKIAVGHKM